MATYYSSYSNEYRLRLDITQGTQNVANNTTVVSWTLSLLSGNKSMSVYSTYNATVNGVTSPSTTQTNVDIGPNSSVTLGSGSTTVTHNSDGTKSVAFSASFKTNSPVYSGGILVTPGTMTISGNFALTTIPRYAAITAFNASINDRSATLSWTADKTISQWRWSSNSGSSYSGWTTVNASSGSTSLSVSPGSTYGFRIQVINSASGLITTSSVVSKTATKTPSTLSLSTTSQNVGSGITWTINESYDYTHQIAYSFGSTGGYILGSDGVTSNTSTGTWTVPTALANQIPNATSGSGTIYIHTYYGSVHVGTKTYTFTARVPNNTVWQPTEPSVTISDVGYRPTGITSYVQGKARAEVVSSSTAQGGASISSYRVTVSGIGTYYGSAITSGHLTNSGTVTITVRATDSRGYYREKVSTIAVAAYSPPKLTTYTAKRSLNDQGTDLATSINFSISSVNSQNAKQYLIRYRPTGGTWVTLVDSTDYYTRSITHSATDVLDANTSYEVSFYLKDSYTEVAQTRNIGTAFVLMDFNSSGRGVAIGKVSESDSFEVAIPFTGAMDLAIDKALDLNSVTAIDSDGNAWNKQEYQHLFIRNANNALHVMVDGITNSRTAWLQVGHQAHLYASALGTLKLNPLGGSVTVNDFPIWHSGNSNVITDSGTNSNGRYVKFSDGTQICWFQDDVEIQTTSLVVAPIHVSSKQLTFPAAFVSNPVVSSAGQTTSANTWSICYGPTTTGVLYRVYGVNSVQTEIAGYIAIGRWK